MVCIYTLYIHLLLCGIYWDALCSLKAQWRDTAKGAASTPSSKTTWKTACHQKQIKTPWGACFLPSSMEQILEKTWRISFKIRIRAMRSAGFQSSNDNVLERKLLLPAVSGDGCFLCDQLPDFFLQKRNQEVGPFFCGGGRLFAAFPADGFPHSHRLETLPEFQVFLWQPICQAVVCLSFYHLLQHLMSNATVVVCHREVLAQCNGPSELFNGDLRLPLHKVLPTLQARRDFSGSNGPRVKHARTPTRSTPPEAPEEFIATGCLLRLLVLSRWSFTCRGCKSGVGVGVLNNHGCGSQQHCESSTGAAKMWANH